MTALGSSMFPFVPTGSTLELAAVDLATVRAGDLLVFVGAQGMLAHRVLAVESSREGLSFVMRGDAQPGTERVGAGSVAYRVTRVSYRGLSYATSGRLGRALGRAAVERGWVFRGLARTATQLVVLHRQLRKLRAHSL